MPVAGDDATRMYSPSCRRARRHAARRSHTDGPRGVSDCCETRWALRRSRRLPRPRARARPARGGRSRARRGRRSGVGGNGAGAGRGALPEKVIPPCVSYLARGWMRSYISTTLDMPLQQGGGGTRGDHAPSNSGVGTLHCQKSKVRQTEGWAPKKAPLYLRRTRTANTPH